MAIEKTVLIAIRHPLIGIVGELFAGRHKRCLDKKITTRRADELLVFPAIRREAPINLGQYWDRIRRKAALPDVRLHDLRHSFASVAIAQHIPLATIGKLLGHALP
ncbi:MAG: tyrosine-type recombinase/integrase [Alteraurantiacibacter sp.]